MLEIDFDTVIYYLFSIIVLHINTNDKKKFYIYNKRIDFYVFYRVVDV